METRAKLNHLRMSARKVRLIADMIRGSNINQAREQLEFSTRRAALPILKLLNSAVANALHNNKLSEDNLFIKIIKVDEGPIQKRWSPRAFGRASRINKRTSHVTIILGELKPTAIKEKSQPDKKDKAAKPDDVKIVNSLDEIKEKETKEKSDKDKDGGKSDFKSAKDQPKGGPRRRLFSRKSG
jgi:large subunit ribosomal protein L22